MSSLPAARNCELPGEPRVFPIPNTTPLRLPPPPHTQPRAHTAARTHRWMLASILSCHLTESGGHRRLLLDDNGDQGAQDSDRSAAKKSGTIKRIRSPASRADRILQGVATCGLAPVSRWAWDAEDTYEKNDWRHWVVNRHTERFSKIALILAGVASLGEAFMMGWGLPTMLYCPLSCDLTEEASIGGELGNVLHGTDSGIFPCNPDCNLPSEAVSVLCGYQEPRPPAPPSSLCSDDCGAATILQYGRALGHNFRSGISRNGRCEDGGPGSYHSGYYGSALCEYGTDCSDCGFRPAYSPSPPPRVPATCLNTCPTRHNNVCDDGGPGSEFSSCGFGTDCEDCSDRMPSPPSLPIVAPPPGECSNECFYWASNGRCEDGGP